MSNTRQFNFERWVEVKLRDNSWREVLTPSAGGQTEKEILQSGTLQSPSSPRYPLHGLVWLTPWLCLCQRPPARAWCSSCPSSSSPLSRGSSPGFSLQLPCLGGPPSLSETKVGVLPLPRALPAPCHTDLSKQADCMPLVCSLSDSLSGLWAFQEGDQASVPIASSLLSREEQSRCSTSVLWALVAQVWLTARCLRISAGCALHTVYRGTLWRYHTGIVAEAFSHLRKWGWLHN